MAYNYKDNDTKSGGYRTAREEAKEKLYEEFVEREAIELDLPAEWIRTCTYIGYSEKPMYYGRGFVDLLALSASKLGLGTLEFGDFKFSFLNLEYVLAKQVLWKNMIYNPREENEDGKICLTVRGQAISKRLDSYFAISKLNCSEPVPDEIIFIPKDLPLLANVRVKWTIWVDNTPTRSSTSSYFINYSKTILGARSEKLGRSGAANYLPSTMITRLKRICYQEAFGNSPDFLLKAHKLKMRDETYDVDSDPIHSQDKEFLARKESQLRGEL